MAHGGLAQAGKVKGKTPKVEKTIKKKKPKGRAAKRAQYNRRIVHAARDHKGNPVQPNKQPTGKLG